MALVKVSEVFKLFPAEYVHMQKVKLRPNEHHYEEDGEPPYIKYSCRICEQIAENVKSAHSYIFEENERFVRFSFPEGTERCPCCGVYIDWDYKYKSK